MTYICLQILYFTNFSNSMILWNTEDNNLVHKSLQLGSVLSQLTVPHLFLYDQFQISFLLIPNFFFKFS